MSGGREAIEARVAGYYTGRLREHGATPRGVDWNGAESQNRRLDVLMGLFANDRDGSVIDIGCGYGALLDRMRAGGQRGAYLGLDVSAEMIAAAKAQHAADPAAGFAVASKAAGVSDYAVASGIFNVRVDTPADAWEAYVESVLDDMHACTRKGFAFNCLTAYSDADRMVDRLYYGDPRRWFDHCVRRYSRWVALRHDYGLYEFTLIVRK